MVSLSGWLACLDGLHEYSLSVMSFGELLAGSSVFFLVAYFYRGSHCGRLCIVVFLIKNELLEVPEALETNGHG